MSSGKMACIWAAEHEESTAWTDLANSPPRAPERLNTVTDLSAHVTAFSDYIRAYLNGGSSMAARTECWDHALVYVPVLL